MAVSDLKPRGIKPDLTLLPARALRAIVAAFKDGLNKYERGNWRKQGEENDWRVTYSAALLRHVLSYVEPDEPDHAPDSGVHHLAHAGACVMILLYLEGEDYREPRTLEQATDDLVDTIDIPIEVETETLNQQEWDELQTILNAPPRDLPGLDTLLERARHIETTPEQREEQRRNFAHANVAMSNPNITREHIDRAADAISHRDNPAFAIAAAKARRLYNMYRDIPNEDK